MNQGDIYWVDLEPVEGSEQGGKRPVVIISGPAMNRLFDVVIGCPLTTRTKNYVGFVPIEKNHENGLKKNSHIIAFQVRAVSKSRFGKRIGQVTPEQLAEVIDILNEVLFY